jgi:predicted metal-dependent hydrolase
MMKERKYFIKNLCEVSIRKRKGNRRMTIRISPEGKVRMIIPYFVSFREAERFIEKKRDWIAKTSDRLKKNRKEKHVYSKDSLPRTKYHEFLITPVNNEELSFRISEGLCEIFVPEKTQVESEKVQKWIHYAFTETLRKEAKVILVNRCKELALDMGIGLNNIRVKNMKTRWGSCSVKRNINLNIHLMRLPDHLLDYVIYHELVHTIHPNHGPLFWRELDKHVGNAKSLAKEIRKWGWVLAN